METPSHIRRSSSASSVYSPDLPVHPRLSRTNKEVCGSITRQGMSSPVEYDPLYSSDYSPILGEFSDCIRYTASLRSGSWPRLSIDTHVANGGHLTKFPLPGSPFWYSAANPADFDLEGMEMDENMATIPAPLKVAKVGASSAKMRHAEGLNLDVDGLVQIELLKRSDSNSSTYSNGSKLSGRSVKRTPLTVTVSHVDQAVVLAGQCVEICVAPPLLPGTPLTSPPTMPENSRLRYTKPSTLPKKPTVVGSLATRFEKASKPAEPMRSNTQKAAIARPPLGPGVVAGLRKKFEFQ